MIRDLKDLSIKGGCFEEKTKLENVFSKGLNIVYGSNGSGKSSIAKGIDAFVNPGGGCPVRVEMDIDYEEYGKVHVFNEDFINSNVNIDDSGLEAIVVIGQQVQVDAEVKQAQSDMQTARDKKTGLEQERPRLEQEVDSKTKELDKLLKGGEYSKRGEELMVMMGKKRVERNLEEIWNDGTALTANDTMQSLTRELDEGLKKLQVVSNSGNIRWNKPVVPDLSLVDSVNMMLTKALPRPMLTEREKLIVTTALDPKLAHYLGDAHRHFRDEGMDYCPLCQRPLGKEYLEELFDGIAKVTEENNTQLFKGKLDEVIAAVKDVTAEDGDFPEQEFFKDMVADCKTKVAALNTVMADMRRRLTEKKQSLYETMESVDGEAYRSALKQCGEAVEKIDFEIHQQQLAKNMLKTLANEMLRKNRQLAFLEHETKFRDWYKAREDANKCRFDIQLREKELQDAENNYSQLTAKMRQTKVAMDCINSYLTVIFNSPTRMRLKEGEDGRYRLMVNGREVKPNAVSTGERNVIALAYYFANLLKDKTPQTAYADEMLLVIDDPISSFDEKNKMGILTLLKRQARLVLGGCRTSKMLILTHDLRTVNMLENMYKSLKNGVLRHLQYEDRDQGYSYLELKERTLWAKKEVKPSQYVTMLEYLIEYVTDDQESEMDDTIGNVIRRFVEMYKSARYGGKDMDKIFDDSRITGNLPESLRDYFSSMVTRQVLNIESHGNMTEDLAVIDRAFSHDEMVKLTKNILAFIYLTDEMHLRYTLNDNDVDVIKAVCNDIIGIAEESACEELQERAENYEGRIFRLQCDERDTYHAEGYKLYLVRGVDYGDYLGKKIKITAAQPNTSWDSDQYPLFAYRWRFVDEGLNRLVRHTARLELY